MSILDLSLNMEYTEQNTLAARQFLQAAVAFDQQSADAWAWLADLLASDYLNLWNNAGETELGQAEAAANTALGINPNHALAHYARGFTLRARGKHRAALFAFDRAIEADASFARAYAHKGAQFLNIGRPEDAAPLVQRAIELSPSNPSIGVFHWMVGRVYFFIEDYSSALPFLQQAVSERPNLSYVWLYWISALDLAGRTAEADQALADFKAYNAAHGVEITDPVALAAANEANNPNTDPFIVAGRDRYHTGLADVVGRNP
jgi:tetratricopeptide (TPR) repeat protein